MLMLTDSLEWWTRRFQPVPAQKRDEDRVAAVAGEDEAAATGPSEATRPGDRGPARTRTGRFARGVLRDR